MGGSLIPSEEFTFKGQILSILRAFKNMKCGLLVQVSVEEKLGSIEFLKIHILIFFSRNSTSGN